MCAAPAGSRSDKNRVHSLPQFDPRPIVGDDYPDTLINRYGNADVKGPGGMHGTHVSGIIATNRIPTRSPAGGVAAADNDPDEGDREERRY